MTIAKGTDQPLLAGAGRPVSFALTFTNCHLVLDGASAKKMKVDLGQIEAMVNAGADGKVILAHLRYLDGKQAPKRAKERDRKNAENARKQTGKTKETARNDATVSDTPRARLYREGSAAIMAMGRTERAARTLIAGWLKLTHDDDQLVLGTILRARDMAVADAAGWILATLRGKAKPNGAGTRSMAAASDDLINRLGGGEVTAGPVIEHEPG